MRRHGYSLGVRNNLAYSPPATPGSPGAYDFRVQVGRETVRLGLRSAGLVWRRPRPVIRPKDPDRERKLTALRVLLRRQPADETAVFMDEADVNLNPKVGCLGMRHCRSVKTVCA